MLAKGVRWFDDWFAVSEIAPDITAIGEPRFHQLNWNYLITGKDRALLFDTGPGVRDIRPVVRAFTDKAVMALPSHMHFDHTGNLHLFDDIAIADLPLLRSFARNGVLEEPENLFLGHYEGMRWRPVTVNRWLPVETLIDLGGRRLNILHTPGHAPDHISLWDEDGGVLLAADFLYLGALYAQVPGSDLSAYERTAEQLLERLQPETQIFGAHGKPDEAGQHAAPLLHKTDMEDLLTTLKRLKKSGDQPSRTEVNPRMHLLTAPHAFAAWQKER